MWGHNGRSGALLWLENIQVTDSALILPEDPFIEEGNDASAQYMLLVGMSRLSLPISTGLKFCRHSQYTMF